MKTNYYNALVLITLLSAGLAFGQGAPNSNSIASDSLDGFNYQTCFAKCVTQHLSGLELRMEIKRQERAFVRSKYHLPETVQLASLGFPSVLVASCNNLGFENGDFTAWTGGIGFDSLNTKPLHVVSSSISTLGMNSLETSCSYHTIVDSLAGKDPNTGLPMVAPQGGKYSVRLGGENINLNNSTKCTAADPNTADVFSSGEFLQQTFNVTAANCLIQYKYQVVLASSPHNRNESDYFRVEVLDAVGNPIPGSQYFVISDTMPPPGFVTGNGVSGALYYCSWSQNSIYLKQYIGQNVTLRFTAAGCVYGGHFAYAYLDLSCSPYGILSSSTTACTGSQFTLTAPPAEGGGTYQWKTVPSGTSGISGSTTSQSALITATGRYEVLITPSTGSPYSLDTTITFYPGITQTLMSSNASCSSCADGSATTSPVGGNIPYTYSWSPAPGAGQGTASISACMPGTYTCTITSKDGCSTTATTTINFSTGINANSLSSSFSVSPNPFGNSLRIVLSGDVKGADLILYDVVGKEVMHQTMAQGSQDLNTAELSPGVYLLSIKSAKGNLIRRIIRQ
jgi:hypothetical protein